MPGTIEGGAKAAATNKAKYGDDFYALIGRVGGKKGRTGGFAYWKSIGREDLISAAGKKGGKISRRSSSVKQEVDGRVVVTYLPGGRA